MYLLLSLRDLSKWVAVAADDGHTTEPMADEDIQVFPSSCLTLISEERILFFSTASSHARQTYTTTSRRLEDQTWA